MGTFHQHKHELHGITVVVDTEGPELYVGRCDDIDERGIILHDAATHRVGDNGQDKQQFLQRIAQVGFWKQHDQLLVPADRIASVRPLGDL